MKDPLPLAEAFVDAVPEEERADLAVSPELEETLRQHLAEAEAAWPDLVIDAADFVGFLGRRIRKRTLASLKITDLYLAFGCLQGDPGAARAFGRALYPVIDQALGGLRQDTSLPADIKQVVFTKLFVAEEGRTPAIHKYDGVGDLRAWVRVVALREGLNVGRKKRRERPLSPEILATLPDSAQPPDEDYLKRVYSDEFKRAFQSAMQVLTHKQRNLLRYYYLDGLTLEEIGKVYRVHKASVSRWLSEVREILLTETRNALVRQLNVGRTELDSIMRLIHSRLDASISRFLND